MLKPFHAISELTTPFYKELHRVASRTDGVSGLPSGFTMLDRLTSGFHPGHLITVGGVTGAGKSAFALNILTHIAVRQGVPVLLFSSEMNDLDLTRRIVAGVCEIKIEKLRSGQLEPYEWAQLDKQMKLLQDKPLHIETTHQLYIEEVCATARRMVRTEGVQLIVVDYLQLMYYKVRMNDSRYVEINAIISQLKSLAMELAVPIIVLSQLNRNIEQREGSEGKRPVPSDLRDSGTIYSDSDEVIFIHRPEMFYQFKDDNGNDLRGKAEIIVAKQRDGHPADFLLDFRGSYPRFSDEEREEAAPQPPENPFKDSPTLPPVPF